MVCQGVPHSTSLWQVPNTEWFVQGSFVLY